MSTTIFTAFPATGWPLFCATEVQSTERFRRVIIYRYNCDKRQKKSLENTLTVTKVTTFWAKPLPAKAKAKGKNPICKHVWGIKNCIVSFKISLLGTAFPWFPPSKNNLATFSCTQPSKFLEVWQSRVSALNLCNSPYPNGGLS